MILETLNTYSLVMLAFGVAVMVYGVLVWFGKNHLSETAKSELTKWLMGQHNDTWQKHYSSFFEAVFGSKHLSVTCFVRSSVASLISAAVIFTFAVDFDGSSSARLEETLPFLDVMILALLINVIPDYLSLYETRLLIKLFSKYRSVILQCVLLIVDLLASGLIIYCYITGYLFFTGQDSIALVEMVGFFSVYSVFFYSTFLTSVWAWLFVLASGTLKLARAIRIENLLDVRANAPAQMSLLISVYALILMLLVAPVASRDEELRASAFDQWLCSIATSIACPHVLRLTGDEQIRLSIQLDLCREGVADKCFAAASFFDAAEDFERAFDIYNSGCQVQSAQSCLRAASLLQDTEIEGRLDRLRYAMLACRLKSPEGCLLHGHLAYGAADDPRGERIALRAYTQGCELESSDACVFQAWMTENGLGVQSDAAAAQKAYRYWCDADNPLACYLAARHLEYGRTGPPNVALALSLYEKSCALGEERSCSIAIAIQNLESGDDALQPEGYLAPWEVCNSKEEGMCFEIGNSIALGEHGPANAVLAARYFDVSCNIGDARGCLQLARLHQLGHSLPKDIAVSQRALAAGCALKEKSACIEMDILNESRQTFFLTTSAKAHFNYVVARCNNGHENSCATVSRVIFNPLLDVERELDETTCYYVGYDSCQDLHNLRESNDIDSGSVP